MDTSPAEQQTHGSVVLHSVCTSLSTHDSAQTNSGLANEMKLPATLLQNGCNFSEVSKLSKSAATVGSRSRRSEQSAESKKRPKPSLSGQTLAAPVSEYQGRHSLRIDSCKEASQRRVPMTGTIPSTSPLKTRMSRSALCLKISRYFGSMLVNRSSLRAHVT